MTILIDLGCAPFPALKQKRKIASSDYSDEFGRVLQLRSACARTGLLTSPSYTPQDEAPKAKDRQPVERLQVFYLQLLYEL